MKQSSPSLLLISIVLGFMLKSNVSFSNPLQSFAKDTIAGIWLGELEIPNAAGLRMGITISEISDNSYKAVLNIIDQATGDIPCDEVSIKNDSVIIRIKGLGIEIAGTILPGLNHLFQTAKTGSEYEYIRIEETISPQALKTISDWILNQTR